MTTTIKSMRRRRTIRRNVKAWLLLTPALFSMILFTHYPFIQTFILSLYRKTMAIRTPAYVGFGNYVKAFNDPLFAKVVGNTLRFSAFVIPVSVIVALLFAYLLNKRIRGVGVFRTLLFYPNVAPAVGFFLVWRYLLQDNIGYINHILKLLNLPTANWLVDVNTAMGAIVVIYLWREASYLMIFLLSGLQSISDEYYEAATIDGANEWHKFTRVTFPLLMPTIMFTLTISISSAVKVLDVIALMTGGGPTYSTSMVMFYIYTYAFSYWDQGMASTYSVLFMIATLLFVWVQNRLLNRVTYYEN